MELISLVDEMKMILQKKNEDIEKLRYKLEIVEHYKLSGV
jgi:hypothetical protein